MQVVVAGNTTACPPTPPTHQLQKRYLRPKSPKSAELPMAAPTTQWFAQLATHHEANMAKVPKGKRSQGPITLHDFILRNPSRLTTPTVLGVGSCGSLDLKGLRIPHSLQFQSLWFSTNVGIPWDKPPKHQATTTKANRLLQATRPTTRYPSPFRLNDR